MIHQLSRATCYLQSFCIRMDGKHILRSHSTGFFIRVRSAILLLTNWHVVTGLDPHDPSRSRFDVGPPHYLKLTVLSRTRQTLVELSVPLYDRTLSPMWREHPNRNRIDIAVIELPHKLQEHFEFVDIHSVEDDTAIAGEVAKEVFILGYPFNKVDLEAQFGGESPYYLPIWKRGSIATEPSLAFGGRVVLIDSLSREGMSGAPVVVAEERGGMRGKTEGADAVIRRLAAGDARALYELDASQVEHVTTKRFRLFGIYSGTIGSTRLAEVALGKCWTVDTLRDTVANAQPGVMPHHAPTANVHYDAFLDGMGGRNLVMLDSQGNETERIPLDR